MKTKKIFFITLLCLAIVLIVKFVPENSKVTTFATKANYVEVSAKDAKTLIDSENITIIDISPFYGEAYLPSKDYISSNGSLDAVIPYLQKEKSYLIYSYFDNLSKSNAETLSNLGFAKIYRLTG